jgi:hypothetical protein
LTASGAITLTTDSIEPTSGTGLISDSGQTATIEPLTLTTAIKAVPSGNTDTGLWLNGNELGNAGFR